MSDPKEVEELAHNNPDTKLLAEKLCAVLFFKKEDSDKYPYLIAWTAMVILNRLGYRKSPSAGMVALDEKAIKDSLGYPTNRNLSDNEISLIKYICSTFAFPSQASVKLPKQKEHEDYCDFKMFRERCTCGVDEWNACLEQFKRLNPNLTEKG